MSPAWRKLTGNDHERLEAHIGQAGQGFALAALLVCSTVTVVFAQDSDPIAALRFEGYAGAPKVTVVPRKDDLFFYPCDQCHAAMEPSGEIRELNTVHVSEIDHGRGRIWCLSCHTLENRNVLSTLLGEPVDFDDAYIVCGGCHANRYRDWSFGAHGKRVANWQGERTLYNCTHCHDPHSPAIEPRAPQPPPPVRAGLTLEQGDSEHHGPLWERRQEQPDQ